MPNISNHLSSNNLGQPEKIKEETPVRGTVVIHKRKSLKHQPAAKGTVEQTDKQRGHLSPEPSLDKTQKKATKPHTITIHLKETPSSPKIENVKRAAHGVIQVRVHKKDDQPEAQPQVQHEAHSPLPPLILPRHHHTVDIYSQKSPEELEDMLGHPEFQEAATLQNLEEDIESIKANLANDQSKIKEYEKLIWAHKFDQPKQIPEEYQKKIKHYENAISVLKTKLDDSRQYLLDKNEQIKGLKTRHPEYSLILQKKERIQNLIIEKRLAPLDSEIEVHKAKIKSLKHDLEDPLKHEEEMLKDIGGAGEKIAKIDHEITVRSRKNKNIDRLKDKKEIWTQSLKSLKDSYAPIENQVKGLKENIRSLEREIDVAINERNNQEFAIAKRIGLKNPVALEVTKLKNELIIAKNQLKDSKKKISKKESENPALHLNKYKKSSSGLKTLIKELEKSIEESPKLESILRPQIKDIEKKLVVVEKQLSEIEDFIALGKKVKTLDSELGDMLSQMEIQTELTQTLTASFLTDKDGFLKDPISRKLLLTKLEESLENRSLTRHEDRLFDTLLVNPAGASPTSLHASISPTPSPASPGSPVVSLQTPTPVLSQLRSSLSPISPAKERLAEKPVLLEGVHKQVLQKTEAVVVSDPIEGSADSTSTVFTGIGSEGVEGPFGKEIINPSQTGNIAIGGVATGVRVIMASYKLSKGKLNKNTEKETTKRLETEKEALKSSLQDLGDDLSKQLTKLNSPYKSTNKFIKFFSTFDLEKIQQSGASKKELENMVKFLKDYPISELDNEDPSVKALAEELIRFVSISQQAFLNETALQMRTAIKKGDEEGLINLCNLLGMGAEFAGTVGGNVGTIDLVKTIFAFTNLSGLGFMGVFSTVMGVKGAVEDLESQKKHTHKIEKYEREIESLEKQQQTLKLANSPTNKLHHIQICIDVRQAKINKIKKEDKLLSKLSLTRNTLSSVGGMAGTAGASLAMAGLVGAKTGAALAITAGVLATGVAATGIGAAVLGGVALTIGVGVLGVKYKNKREFAPVQKQHEEILSLQKKHKELLNKLVIKEDHFDKDVYEKIKDELTDSLKQLKESQEKLKVVYNDFLAKRIEKNATKTSVNVLDSLTKRIDSFDKSELIDLIREFKKIKLYDGKDLSDYQLLELREIAKKEIVEFALKS